MNKICGADLKDGKRGICQNPPMQNGKCASHGGLAKSIHGYWSIEEISIRRENSKIIKELHKILDRLE